MQYTVLFTAIIGTFFLSGCQTRGITTYYKPTTDFHVIIDGKIYGAVRSEEHKSGFGDFSDHKTFSVSAVGQ